MTYRNRVAYDPERGAAINVKRDYGRQILLELGEWRPVGAFADDAWAALTPEEARELGRDLIHLADDAEREPRR